MTDRETARLTADVVLVAPDDEGTLHVLLIERGKEPFGLALPGGHLKVGEYAEDAAHRELHEETGISLDENDLIEVRSYSSPGRDPRGRYVTFAYAAHLDTMPNVVAGDDAHATRWMPVREALAAPNNPLLFDHNFIVFDALNRLRLSA